VKGSFGAIVAVDIKGEFPKRCRVFPVTHVRGTKRKRSRSTSEPSNIDESLKAENSASCTMCLRYNSMLFLNCFRESEMVVVEQPWLNIVATLPGSLQRKVYGT
jgi:U3 small nucleolar RNA-associated protein 4